MMSLQEYEEKGGCQGCYFYCEVEPGRQACTFHWLDDESEDWEFSKNCDELDSLGEQRVKYMSEEKEVYEVWEVSMWSDNLTEKIAVFYDLELA